MGALHDVRFTKKSGLSCARAAHHEDIQIPAVFLPVKPDADVLGQQLVFRCVFISVLFIQSTCAAP